jgi:hypothetical protein
MWGKITMSRIGIMGSLRVAPLSTSLGWFAIILPIRRFWPGNDADVSGFTRL